MSQLIVSQDSCLMMMEVAVENLFMPWSTKFDVAIMKKTRVMFRMLDDEWTVLMPNRRDNKSYRGSNFEREPFYGGKSIVFAIPNATLEEDVHGVDVQFSVHKEVSEYLETGNFGKDVGFTLVTIDNLFNGIIKELRERKELADYLSVPNEREPISRSMKGVYPLLNDDSKLTDSTIELFVRISYLGSSVITDMNVEQGTFEKFFVSEETNQCHPYQCRQIKKEDLEAGRWGSLTFTPPIPSDCLMCKCSSGMTECSDFTGKKN
ncbi:uncharacterized protein [Prorops nasuta]|uniref:uncharacterized protein n=1 Tax=Prorops nasuta TaxID=863751 RepID=UPI0034D00794